MPRTAPLDSGSRATAGDVAARLVVTFSLARLNRCLLFAALFLSMAGVGAQLAVHVLGAGDLYGIVPLLNLSEEQNVPSWYSTMLLLACAALLAMIAALEKQRGTRHVWRWKLLAGIFLYMSVDEAVSIHELLNQFIDLPGILYFGWVIPAGVLVAVLMMVYLPLLRDLPTPNRWAFALAGMVYVGGALGVELVLGYWTDLHGTDNLLYGLIDAVEETLEIAGLSLFLSALAGSLAARSPELCVAIRTEPARAGTSS